MSDLLTKMRAKQQSKPTEQPSPKAPAPPAATASQKAKPPRKRKCCETMKGDAHMAGCQTLAPPKPKKAKKETKPFRLPNGATFHMTYDAAAVLWSVELRIGEQVLTCKAGGVHTGLMVLGKKWANQQKELEGL